MRQLTTVFVILFVLSFLVGNVGTAQADSTVFVTPSNMGLWSFHQFAPSGSGAIVDGPGTPPLGFGSARLTTTSTNGGISLRGTGYFSTRLDTLTRLEYSSYRATSDSNNNRAVMLQLEVDYDIDDPDSSKQGWLVYEPYRTAGAGTVLEDTWYTWNALNGKWYATDTPGSTNCPQSNPCTMSQLLSWYPDVGIRHNGYVQLVAGSAWGLAFTGYADALTIGVSGVNTTYDFELNDLPTASTGGPYTGDEGANVSLDGTASDPEGDPLTYAWSFTPGLNVDPGATCTFGDPAALDTTVSCTDAGEFALTLTVNDGINPPITSSTTLTLAEANPSVTITSPTSGTSFREGQQVDVSTNVSDAGNDSLTCNVDWGDGSTSEGVIVDGICTASHVYGAPGDYTITVTVTDDDGGSAAHTTGIAIFNDPPTVDAGGVYSGDEGRDIDLSGSASDQEGDPLVYAWSYTPGPGFEPGVTCTFGDPSALLTTFTCTDDGLFFLTLSVDDGVNPVSSDSTSAFLANLEPVLNIISPTEGDSFPQGQQVDLSAHVEDLGDNDTLSCQVDWGDGTTVDGEVVGEYCTASHTFSQTGDYTLTATVIDDDGGSHSDTTGITVLNVSPTVDITSPVANASFSTGSSVDLSATVYDPGGDDQLACMVDWGDGETSAGFIADGVCTASHAYTQPATYLITVAITDEDNGTASDTVSIQVINLAPTVEAGGPYTGGEGNAINLSGFANDPEGDSLTFAWTYTPAADVDAGTTCAFANAAAAVTSLSCTDNGSFTLTLTVDDGFNPPVSDTAALTLNNYAPVVNVTAPADGSTFTTGESVNLSASFTDSGSNDTHTCKVAWGDGNTTNGTVASDVCSATHAYDVADSYTLTVTLEDDDLNAGNDSVAVTVNSAPNSPPTPEAGGAYSGNEGQEINLNGSASDPEGDALTYSWTYSVDGSVGPGTTCAFGNSAALATTFTCSDNGQFTLTLKVSDGHNPPVSDTALLTVDNLPPAVTINEPVVGPTYLIGEAISLNATFTNPGGNDTNTCQVDWGDGTFTDGIISDTACTASHTYIVPGGYALTVTVSDDDGDDGSDSVNLTVSDEPQSKAGPVFLPLITKNWYSGN